MNQFTLRKYSFGDYLGIVGDEAHSRLAEERKRIDADGDMPKLAEACGIKNGDAVIDIGGWIGDTALPFLRIGAHVTAFEPFLDAYVAMLYNTRHYPHMFRGLNAPVGNGEWVKYIYECPGSNYGMRRMEVAPPASPGAVKTVRIDNCAVGTAVKLIKCDCEGSEIPALLGAKELIERDRPFLYVEVYDDGLKNRGYTRTDLADCISSLGYDMTMWGEEPRFDWWCSPKK